MKKTIILIMLISLLAISCSESDSFRVGIEDLENKMLELNEVLVKR